MLIIINSILLKSLEVKNALRKRNEIPPDTNETLERSVDSKMELRESFVATCRCTDIPTDAARLSIDISYRYIHGYISNRGVHWYKENIMSRIYTKWLYFRWSVKKKTCKHISRRAIPKSSSSASLSFHRIRQSSILHQIQWYIYLILFSWVYHHVTMFSNDFIKISAPAVYPTAGILDRISGFTFKLFRYYTYKCTYK